MWIVVPGYSASAPGSEDSTWAWDWRFEALAQSVWWRGKLRSSDFWFTKCSKDECLMLLSGAMPEPSMADRGVAEFMESLPVIPASHSASQESDEEPRTRDTSGPRSSASLAKWNPSSCSWRMSQGTSNLDSTECLVILPKSGSTRSGRLYERPMSEPHTEGSESSSWPTAVVGDSRSSARHTTSTGIMHSGTMLTDAIRQWPTPRAITGGAESAERKKELGRTASGGGDLQSEAAQWATPITRDRKDGADPSDKTLTNALFGLQDPKETGAASPNTSGLRLNPNFVEWLMGFPEGWTVCEPSATLSSRSKQHSRSDSSSQGSNNE